MDIKQVIEKVHEGPDLGLSEEFQSAHLAKVLHLSRLTIIYSTM